MPAIKSLAVLAFIFRILVLQADELTYKVLESGIDEAYTHNFRQLKLWSPLFLVLAKQIANLDFHEENRESPETLKSEKYWFGQCLKSKVGVQILQDYTIMKLKNPSAQKIQDCFSDRSPNTFYENLEKLHYSMMPSQESIRMLQEVRQRTYDHVLKSAGITPSLSQKQAFLGALPSELYHFLLEHEIKPGSVETTLKEDTSDAESDISGTSYHSDCSCCEQNRKRMRTSGAMVTTASAARVKSETFEWANEKSARLIKNMDSRNKEILIRHYESVFLRYKVPTPYGGYRVLPQGTRSNPSVYVCIKCFNNPVKNACGATYETSQKLSDDHFDEDGDCELTRDEIINSLTQSAGINHEIFIKTEKILPKRKRKH